MIIHLLTLKTDITLVVKQEDKIQIVNQCN